MHHALFVVHDDLGGTKIEQAIEAVVAVDHATVKVIQVRGSKAATIELNHWAKFWWDHGDHIENHCPGVIDQATVFVTLVERRNNLQALDRLLLALCRKWLAVQTVFNCIAKLCFFADEVH